MAVLVRAAFGAGEVVPLLGIFGADAANVAVLIRERRRADRTEHARRRLRRRRRESALVDTRQHGAARTLNRIGRRLNGRFLPDLCRLAHPAHGRDHLIDIARLGEDRVGAGIDGARGDVRVCHGGDHDDTRGSVPGLLRSIEQSAKPSTRASRVSLTISAGRSQRALPSASAPSSASTMTCARGARMVL